MVTSDMGLVCTYSLPPTPFNLLLYFFYSSFSFFLFFLSAFPLLSSVTSHCTLFTVSIIRPCNVSLSLLPSAFHIVEPQPRLSPISPSLRAFLFRTQTKVPLHSFSVILLYCRFLYVVHAVLAHLLVMRLSLSHMLPHSSRLPSFLPPLRSCPPMISLFFIFSRISLNSNQHLHNMCEASHNPLVKEIISGERWV